MANLPVSGEWTSSPEIPIQLPPPPVLAGAAKKKLNIVLPFIESDIPRVNQVLQWCAELSGKLPYSIFLMPFKGINFTEVKMYAERAFTDVQIITDSEGVSSDWKNDSEIRDAAGPNSFFRQAAWFFYFNKALGPWLYLEPDCVPLTPTWVQALENDHFLSGSPISGVQMDVGDKPYLNGVAIYPADLIQIAPEVVTRTMWQQHPDLEVAFDIAGGDKVLNHAHQTDKIQLAYRARWHHEADKKLTETAVLFHGDQDGHLLKTLRANRNGKGGDTVVHEPNTKPEATDSPRETQTTTTTEVTPNGAALAEVVPSRYIGEEIRYHCDELSRLVREAPSRAKTILIELRKRSLCPQAKKRK